MLSLKFKVKLRFNVRNLEKILAAHATTPDQSLSIKIYANNK